MLEVKPRKLPKRIGIIRISSLGDIVLISPIIRCLYQQLEQPELILLTHKDMLPLFEHNPFLHKAIAYDPSEPEKSAAEFLACMLDLIVDLQKNLRSSFLKLGAGLPVLTFSKQNVRKWKMVNLKNGQGCRHVVLRMLQGLNALGISDDGLGVELHLPAEETSEDSWKQRFHGGYIAIGIGSAHATKALSMEFLTSFLARQSLPCVLLGGPNDQLKGEALQAKFPERVRSLCGQTDLLTTAYWVRDSAHVVSGDSFIMHLAACFSKPLDVVWTNTVPEFGMEPYYGTAQAFKAKYHQTKELNCRPCTKTGFSACPKGHFNCMNRISAWIVQSSLDMVFDEAATF
jgi:ADP-heptose:LPS heptosyltransferase